MTFSDVATTMFTRARLSIFSFVFLMACTGDSRTAVQRLAVADTTVTWDASSRLVGDVDCDGVADSAFIGRTTSAVHVGLILGKVASPEILTFAIGSGIQKAVCSHTAALVFESLDYDPKDAVGEIDGFRRSAVCKGLNLGDGDCDSIHLFWNASSRHLDWWRA